MYSRKKKNNNKPKAICSARNHFRVHKNDFAVNTVANDKMTFFFFISKYSLFYP